MSNGMEELPASHGSQIPCQNRSQEMYYAEAAPGYCPTGNLLQEMEKRLKKEIEELQETTAKLKQELYRTQEQTVVAVGIILAFIALVAAILFSMYSSEITRSNLDAAVRWTDSSSKTEVREWFSETFFRSTTHGALQIATVHEKVIQMKQDHDEDVHRLNKQVESLQSTTWVGSIVITVVVTIITGFCIFLIILYIRN